MTTAYGVTLAKDVIEGMENSAIGYDGESMLGKELSNAKREVIIEIVTLIADPTPARTSL